MARRYRFRGELSGVDATAWVNNHRRLRQFRDQIEGRLPGTADQRRQRAQDLTERLLIGALDDFGTHYVDGLSHHIDEIGRLRDEIRTLYDAVQGLEPHATALPSNLTPDSLNRLFQELETHLDAVEGRTPTRHLSEHEREIPTENIEQVMDDIDSASARRTGEHEAPIEGEAVPDVLLDDPRLAEYEMQYMHLPEHQRRWAAAQALRREEQVSISERQRVSRLAYRELSPEDRVLRRQLEIEAELFSFLHLPDGAEARLRRLPAFGEANLAQLERLRELDTTFLGRGYELRIRGPGFDFMPDGVWFLDEGRTRYMFLEHKEPLTVRERSYYDTPEGRRDLEATLERHAEVAARLSGHGCVGFQWSTGQPWLDETIADAIARIRETNPNGRFLLLAGD